jgi:hypothetical protein
VIIKNEAEFDSGLVRLRDLLDKVERSPPTPAILPAIHEAEELNRALNDWINNNTREAIEVLIGLSPFLTPTEATGMIADISEMFPDARGFVEECKRRYGFV